MSLMGLVSLILLCITSRGPYHKAEIKDVIYANGNREYYFQWKFLFIPIRFGPTLQTLEAAERELRSKIKIKDPQLIKMLNSTNKDDVRLAREIIKNKYIKNAR